MEKLPFQMQTVSYSVLLGLLAWYSDILHCVFKVYFLHATNHAEIATEESEVRSWVEMK